MTRCRPVDPRSSNLHRAFSSRARSPATFSLLRRHHGHKTAGGLQVLSPPLLGASVELAATRARLEAGGGLCRRRAIEGGEGAEARRSLAGGIRLVGYLRQSVFGGRSMADRRRSVAMRGRASREADIRAVASLQLLLRRPCVSPVVALGQQPR